MSNDKPFFLEIDGYCPICEAPARFVSKDPWLRGALMCQTCPNGSVPRERALALMLNRLRPSWRGLSIHECSPADRGISAKMSAEAPGYVGSHYRAGEDPGVMIGGFRNEDIERTTFEDNTFDVVISLDVFEHIWNPGAAIADIYRTLRPGGLYLSTFPIRNYQVESHEQRAKRGEDGMIVHVRPEEIHGNPIDGSGSLVTWDYGYDVHKALAWWAPFDVEIVRFADRRHGILGEYLDVTVCRRPRTDRPSLKDAS